MYYHFGVPGGTRCKIDQHGVFRSGQIGVAWFREWTGFGVHSPVETDPSAIQSGIVVMNQSLKNDSRFDHFLRFRNVVSQEGAVHCHDHTNIGSFDPEGDIFGREQVGAGYRNRSDFVEPEKGEPELRPASQQEQDGVSLAQPAAQKEGRGAIAGLLDFAKGISP